MYIELKMLFAIVLLFIRMIMEAELWEGKTPAVSCLNAYNILIKVKPQKPP